MKRSIPLLSLALLFLCISCSSGSDVKKIAKDLCNCYSNIEANMSERAIGLIKIASYTSDPQATLELQLKMLGEEERIAIASEIMTIVDGDDCTSRIEAKYNNKYTLDEKAFIQKVIRQLESKKGCSLTAAIMRMGVKAKEKAIE